MTNPRSPTPHPSPDQPREVILRLTDVHRVHGTGPTAVRALDGVSVQVRAGELVAVMGPSGSGKSTLLNLAGALDLPSSGTVEIEGQVTTTLRPQQLAALRRRRVGVVFQDLNLIPSLTAAENIGLPLELDGRRVSEARRAAIGALHELGLDELADRFPDQMSGGQPVSYTHLDVYKRQTPSWCRAYLGVPGARWSSWGESSIAQNI